MTKKNTSRPRLRVLATEDPNSMFHRFSAQEILEKLGPPRTLLSRSAKSDKSEKVQVHSRLLYLTSGLFCPKATTCRAVCLGHASGRMTMLQSANARDRRTAQYLVDPEHFLGLLRAELRVLEHEACTADLLAAVRLNGSSDLP